MAPLGARPVRGRVTATAHRGRGRPDRGQRRAVPRDERRRRHVVGRSGGGRHRRADRAASRAPHDRAARSSAGARGWFWLGAVCGDMAAVALFLAALQGVRCTLDHPLSEAPGTCRSKAGSARSCVGCSRMPVSACSPFATLTRFISSLIEIPYDFARDLLVDGFIHRAGHARRSDRAPAQLDRDHRDAGRDGPLRAQLGLAALVGACFRLPRGLRPVGQRDGHARLGRDRGADRVGGRAGAGHRVPIARHWFERALRPVLDLMQTVPIFAYLVPILFLFGFGPVSALVATVIYAMPPMVRVATSRCTPCPPEVVEAVNGRLHQAADDVESAGALGRADADGGRQSGHHAVAQHGDHRVDDRCGRPWL